MDFYNSSFKFDSDNYEGIVDLQVVISAGPSPLLATSVTAEVFDADGGLIGPNELAVDVVGSTFTNNSLGLRLTLGPDIKYFEEYTIRINIDGSIGDVTVSFCGHQDGLDLIPYRHKLTSAVVNKPLMQLDQKVKHAFCKIENLRAISEAELEVSATPDEGEYVRSSLQVALECNQEGSQIYYGVYDPSDSTVPDQIADNLYDTPIELICPSGSTENYVIRCFAVFGANRSEIFEFDYRLVNETLSVSASPAGGTFNSTVGVTLSANIVDADIYYTLDGSDPSDSSTLYTGPISISSTTTLKAIAYATDGTGRVSGIMTENYTVNTGAFIVNINSGSSQPTDVTFSATKGADVTSATTFYYTLDGSTPSTSSTVWNGSPIHIDESSAVVVKVLGVYGADTNTASKTLPAACVDDIDISRRIYSPSPNASTGKYANGTNVDVYIDEALVQHNCSSSYVDTSDTGFSLDGQTVTFRVDYKIGWTGSVTSYTKVGGLPTNTFTFTGTDESVVIYARVVALDGSGNTLIEGGWSYGYKTFGSVTDNSIDISLNGPTNCSSDVTITLSSPDCTNMEYKIASTNPSSPVAVDWTSYSSPVTVAYASINVRETLSVYARCASDPATEYGPETFTLDPDEWHVEISPASGSDLAAGDEVVLTIKKGSSVISGTCFICYYKVDGGTEQSFTADDNNKTIPLTTVGSHTIEYRLSICPAAGCGPRDTSTHTATFNVASSAFTVSIDDPSSGQFSKSGNTVYSPNGETLSVGISCTNSSATKYYTQNGACSSASDIVSSGNAYSSPLSISSNTTLCAAAKSGSTYSDNIDSIVYKFVHADYQSGANYYNSVNKILVLNGGVRDDSGSCSNYTSPSYHDIVFTGAGIDVSSTSDISITPQFSEYPGFSLSADSIVSSSDTSLTVRFKAEAPLDYDPGSDGTQDRMKYDISIKLDGGFTDVYEVQVRTGKDAWSSATWCTYEVDVSASKMDYSSTVSGLSDGQSNVSLDQSGSSDSIPMIVPKPTNSCLSISNRCGYTIKLAGSGISNISLSSISFTQGSPGGICDAAHGGSGDGTGHASSDGTTYNGEVSGYYQFSGTCHVSPPDNGYVTLRLSVTFGDGTSDTVYAKIPITIGVTCSAGEDLCGDPGDGPGGPGEPEM